MSRERIDAGTNGGLGDALYLAAAYLEAMARLGDCSETRNMLHGLNEDARIFVRLGARLRGTVLGVEFAPRIATPVEVEDGLSAPVPIVQPERECPVVVMVLERRDGKLFECGRTTISGDGAPEWKWTKRPVVSGRALLERALSAIPPRASDPLPARAEISPRTVVYDQGGLGSSTVCAVAVTYDAARERGEGDAV